MVAFSEAYSHNVYNSYIVLVNKDLLLSILNKNSIFVWQVFDRTLVILRRV